MTLFDKGFSGTPRWSPDGRWIAFDHHTVTHGHIYLIDSEGRNLHVVTSGNYENIVPGWSRDATSVYSPPTAPETGRCGGGSLRPDEKPK
jgi:tricorn protease-like protein